MFSLHNASDFSGHIEVLYRSKAVDIEYFTFAFKISKLSNLRLPSSCAILLPCPGKQWRNRGRWICEFIRDFCVVDANRSLIGGIIFYSVFSFCLQLLATASRSIWIDPTSLMHIYYMSTEVH